MRSIIPSEVIQAKIFIIRKQKVMIDNDLAGLYHIETKTLKRAVKRNPDRFPKDFMFELTRSEYNSLRYHFGTLKRGQHSKYLPFVFTEQGVAMLSSVLNSKTAIRVNIEIMRAFVKLRELISSNRKLEKKLEEMEKKYYNHDNQIREVFELIHELMSPPKIKKNKIVI